MADTRLLDASAFWHLGHPGLGAARRAELADLVARGSVAASTPLLLETRAGRELPSVDPAELPLLLVSPRAERRAAELQRQLRDRHQHLGVPPLDYLIAAMAEDHGAVLLHDDRDFERLAEDTDLAVATELLAPLGALRRRPTSVVEGDGEPVASRGMDPVRLALLPLTAAVGTARTLAGLGEIVTAARPLAAAQGPIRREDGIGERLEHLLAPAGALEQLEQLGTLAVTLERLAELDETLKTLGQLEESLRTLSTLGESLDSLATLGDSLDSLAKLGDSLESLANVAASLEQLSIHARVLPELSVAVETLPQLPARVISVEDSVGDIGKVLARLEPSLDALGRNVESLSRSLVPLGKVVERLPGQRRRAPSA